jgi:hypothetical protein
MVGHTYSVGGDSWLSVGPHPRRQGTPTAKHIEQGQVSLNNLEVFALIILGCFLCIANWRAGFLICIVAGFLQDPIRKLVPDEPVYLTATVGIFVAATFLGASLRGVRLRFRPIHTWYKSLRLPMSLFAGLVIIQSILALVNTGSPMLALIGLLAYLSPLPAILLGYNFCSTEKQALQYLRTYIFLSLAMTSGIFLSYAGYDWKILESVGEGLFAYAPTGEQLTLFPGFFRAPEVAAWHIGTGICLLGVVLLAAKRKALKWLCGPLIAFFATALVLTGRRKFFVEIVLFAAIYLLMLTLFRRGAIKSAATIMGAIVVGFLVYVYAVPDDVTASIRPYYERGQNVQAEGMDRLSGNTIQSFQWVIDQNGILGSGAGTGSQGAQYFGGGSDLVGLSAEGGLGKVLAELGLPGLVLALWLAIAVGLYMWSVIKYLNDSGSALAGLACGFVAFLVANAFVYLVAHQAFGDVFILINLGFMLGFVMAMPRIQGQQSTRMLRASTNRAPHQETPTCSNLAVVPTTARCVR